MIRTVREHEPDPEPTAGSRERRPMNQARARMTEIVMPNDTNPHGSVSGGRVMHLIDVCAAVAALRHARRSVVTAAVDELQFLAPVPLGHILLLDAQVTFAGETSMEVKVSVRGENPLTGEKRHTTTAYLTFVALDPAGRPVVIPELVPESEEERALYSRAQARREERLARARRAAAPGADPPNGAVID